MTTPVAGFWRRRSIAEKSGLILGAFNLLITALLAATLHLYAGAWQIAAIVFGFGAAAMVPIAWLARQVESASGRGWLIERLMSVQEEERGRIAAELHDEVNQSLASLLVGLQALERGIAGEDQRAQLATLREVTSQTMDQVRLLSLELRPKILDELGLVPALRAYARDFEARHGMPVRVEVEGLGARLPARVELILYRVIQEALANAASYARAGEIQICFRQQAQELLVEVRDDGVGFDLDRVPFLNKRPHLGIMGMRERAALVDGRLSIDTGPGQGTRVSVRIPLGGQPGVPTFFPGKSPLRPQM